MIGGATNSRVTVSSFFKTNQITKSYGALTQALHQSVENIHEPMNLQGLLLPECGSRYEEELHKWLQSKRGRPVEPQQEFEWGCACQSPRKFGLHLYRILGPKPYIITLKFSICGCICITGISVGQQLGST